MKMNNKEEDKKQTLNTNPSKKSWNTQVCAREVDKKQTLNTNPRSSQQCERPSNHGIRKYPPEK